MPPPFTPPIPFSPLKIGLIEKRAYYRDLSGVSIDGSAYYRKYGIKYGNSNIITTLMKTFHFSFYLNIQLCGTDWKRYRIVKRQYYTDVSYDVIPTWTLENTRILSSHFGYYKPWPITICQEMKYETRYETVKTSVVLINIYNFTKFY